MSLEIYNAAKEGILVDVKSLIEQGANVNATDNEGKSALYWASEQGHFEIVKLLIKNKANINIATANGYTPLHLAMMREHYEIAALLIKNGADVNAATANNSTPLHFAATSESGSPVGIKLLIENNAVVDVADAEYGETPLFRACIDGFSDRVELLIKHGADVNKVSHNKASPLYWSSKRDHIEVIKLLIKHGANVNNADIYEESSLHGAAADGQINAAKLLLKYGADINKIDVDGETPLFKAFRFKYIETAKFFIDAMLEQNPLQKKPNFIEPHQDLSGYWDEDIKKIITKISLNELVGKTVTEDIVNKISLVKTGSTLLSLTYHQFFKLLNPEAIKKIVSNKTDNSEGNTSSPPGLDK